MTTMRWMTAAGAAAMLAGCAASEGGGAEGGRYMAGRFKAEAMLKTAAGADAGTVAAQEADGGLRVTVTVMGLPAGAHGAHVHTTGKCGAPDFASAGGHWNPTARMHGLENPAGPHAGDMPNLIVGADGKGELSFTLPAGTYEGLLDPDGAAFVVHAGADDMKTDPSGNSGGRIACGVFGAV